MKKMMKDIRLVTVKTAKRNTLKQWRLHFFQPMLLILVDNFIAGFDGLHNTITNVT